jgi:serine phosphatase RsbU (regulator of sigma subunit)
MKPMDSSSPLATGNESDAMLDELARAYEELDLLHGLAGVLEDEIDHRLIFQKIIGCLRELVPVETAEVWVPNREAGEYRCFLHYERGGMSSRLETTPFDPGLQQPILNMGVRVLREKQKHECAGPLDLFLVRICEGIGFPSIAVPLLSKSKLVGLFLLGIPSQAESLDASALRLVAAAARQTSLSIHLSLLIDELRANEGLKREIEIARQIQHDLLPQSIPQSTRYDVFAGCVTAARVGGDYYDFFTESPSKLGLLIADVAGHSVASALIAMSFRTSFRHFLAQGLELGELFAKVNDALHKELNKSGNFLSAFFGILDEEKRTFSYVNAGHNPPLLWSHASGTFRELGESGLLLGVLPEQSYSAAEVPLEPGDVLLGYTDGIVEAENQHGELFGLKRLEAAIRKHLSRGAREMYHYLLKEMYLFQDEHFNKDDVTLAVLKAKGG